MLKADNPVSASAELRSDLDRIRTLVEESAINQARAEVITLAEKWPESADMQHWKRVLDPPKVISSHGPASRPLDEEVAWYRAHAHEYPGRWLAIYKDRLIAQGIDYQSTVAAARSAVGNEEVVVLQAPDAQK